MARSAELAEQSLRADFWDDSDLVRELLDDASIVRSSVVAWSEGGGLSGDSRVVTIARNTGGAEHVESRYFLKLTKESGMASSKANGLAREGVLLSHLRDLPAVAAHVPVTHFAHGNMATGRKVILTELVDGVQAGYFFGPGSPHNIGKDLAALTAACPGVSEADVVAEAFRVAASIHAAYWRDATLLADPRFSTLRCREWGAGGGRDSWEAGFGFSHGLWQKSKPTLHDPDKVAAGLVVDTVLEALVDAAFARTTWEAFSAVWTRLPLTLVHGDFHPANMIVRRVPPAAAETAAPAAAGCAGRLALVDWEAAAVGSGPQDLGQFMISHASPAARRTLAPGALRSYAAALTAAGCAGVTEEGVLEEYVQGGLGRWIWFIPILIAWCPPAQAQYFCDQMLTFARDHGVGPENAPLVRP